MTPEKGQKINEYTNKTNKVTALITAESIIAGFMIAYGALVGQMLVYWADPLHWSDPLHPPSLLTTYFAGVLIYAIVLTCFVSILLLFKSLDAEETDDSRYKAGYCLFIWAIVVSCLYVALNVGSIYHFTVTPDHKPLPLPAEPGATLSLIGFIDYAAFLFFLGVLAILKYSEGGIAGSLGSFLFGSIDDPGLWRKTPVVLVGFGILVLYPPLIAPSLLSTWTSIIDVVQTISLALIGTFPVAFGFLM